jgi:hypothetical protein
MSYASPWKAVSLPDLYFISPDFFKAPEVPYFNFTIRYLMLAAKRE